VRAALLIEYDGTDFSGWQIQPGVRTVQGEIEKALNRITGQQLQLTGAGRTDTGVHATGMVAHVDLLREYDLPRFILGLNATSGEDVVVREIRPVEADFHARFTAISRAYEYTLTIGFSALLRKHSWEIRKQLDLKAMNVCASLLLGEHDFTSFSKWTEDVKHFRCQIEIAEWKVHGTHFVFSIQANRFVRGMVRALTGAMVQVGLGILPIEKFRDLLAHPQELDRAKYMAPPHGLVLTKVGYPPELGLW
jgi:tRNA pseudouridine38-40 synthase